MDEVSKHRLTGALIWLTLLVVLVPVWFGEPVHFDPESYSLSQPVVEERPLVGMAYRSSEKVSGEEVAINKVMAKKTSGESREQSAQKPQWIVRIIAYKEMKSANDLLGRLESDFDVSIKTFEATGMHSVRAGPYLSKAKAEQDKQKLDKMLHIQSEIVRLP